MKRPSELCSLSLLTELETELEDVEGKDGDGRGSCKSADPNPSLLRPSPWKRGTRPRPAAAQQVQEFSSPLPAGASLR